MANQTINVRTLLRTDTTANWTTNSSKVLLKGEFGVEILTSGKKKIKIGDGTTTWANLAYFGSSDIITNSTAPTSADYQYDVGTMWITTGNLIYILTSVSGTTANWVQLGTSEDQNTTYTLGLQDSAATGKIVLTGSDNSTNVVSIAPSGAITVSSAADGDIAISSPQLVVNAPSVDAGTTLADINIITEVTNSAHTISLKKKKLTAGSNVTLTPTASGNIEIAAADTDTGATSVEVSGSGNAVSSASYAAGTRKLTLTKGITAITGVTDASVANGLVTAIGASGTNITSTKGVSYSTTAPSASSTDTTLPTSKAVNSAIAAAVSANDSMTYKGTLGTSGATVTALPTSGNKVGDTYKVITSGVYYQSTGTTTGSGAFASLGDLFIAQSTTGNWDYIPSGNDGNVYHASSLTNGAVIIGANGDDVEALANGSNGQILKIVSGSPAWGNETDTGATSITVSGSGNVVSAASYAAGTRAITLTKGVTALTGTSAETADTETTLSSIMFVAGSDPISTSGTNVTSTYRKLVAGSGMTIAATTNGNVTFAPQVFGSDNTATTVAPSAGIVQAEGSHFSGSTMTSNDYDYVLTASGWWKQLPNTAFNNTTYSAAVSNDLTLNGTQFSVTYSKAQLTTNLNADTDILILNGGTSSTWA